MELFLELKAMLEEKAPDAKVLPRKYPCFGGCDFGVNLIVHPDGLFYSEVTMDDLGDIVAHLTGEGEPVTRLTGKVPPDVEEFIFDLLNTGY